MPAVPAHGVAGSQPTSCLARVAGRYEAEGRRWCCPRLFLGGEAWWRGRLGQDKDQVHGPCWWKTPTEPKVYLFLSNLKHSEQDKVDRIMSVAFETFVRSDGST